MGTGNNRIYIIEDDPDFGYYLERLIRQSGLGEVRLLDDGLKGLQACLSDPPDLVVLDLDLPLLRGEEICRLLRSSPYHKSVPILICSEMPQAQRKEMEMLQIGANVYVEKPFVEEAFLENLNTLLKSRTAQRPPSEDKKAEVPRARLSQETTQVDASPTNAFQGYTILGVLGAGAMGTVYKALQMNLDRVVALKVLLRSRGDTDEVAERFRREALIMAQLNHPNILHIYDTGSTGYTFYIAMEFVKGGSLFDKIAEGSIPFPEALNIIKQSCNAIMHLHEQGIIHRDIKPGNILVHENRIVKIGDFGISRAYFPTDQEQFTRRNLVMGTPTYMAPELNVGIAADELSDQYALGRTFLHMFEGKSPNFPSKPLKTIRPDLPVPLSDALERSMHLDPAQRFRSIGDMRTALLAACEGVPS